jgi:hypothetical protein
MQNSNNPDKETAAVRLYLDESGTRDPNTPQAVIGGILINYSYFLHFEECWNLLLEEFGIDPPLHMKEFTPHGRFAHIHPPGRRYLFAKVAELIDSHRIATIEATLTNAEYETAISQEIRDQFSVYAACFNLVVVMNHKLAEHNKYAKRIPFILDSGNPYAEHVREAHAAALQMQEQVRFLNAGGLRFEDDKNFGVLQAADVIAWAARRHASKKHFPDGFEPLLSIFEGDHFENTWKVEWLTELEGRLQQRLAEKRAEILKENNDEGI